MNDDHIAGTEPSAGAREPKVIKRYTNRKLNDTVESRYVTLAQIIFEEEKKTSKMSLETLRDLIRHGGEVAQRLVEGTQAELRGRVEAVRAAAEQRVQSLLTRGQQTSDRAKERVQASQEAMAAFQRRVDERVRSAVEQMSAVSDVRRSLEDISRRIGELERRLAEVSQK